MDSATDASQNDLSEEELVQSDLILERLERYAAENPDATEYRLDTEIEAQQLLIAMAAALKLMSKDIEDRKDRQVLTNYANTYRQKVIHGKALEYIRELSEEDQLTIHGMKIVAPVIILQ